MRHGVAELREDRVRRHIVSLIETGGEFPRVSAEAVLDADIRSACLSIAVGVDLSEETGGAEFRAALAAVRAAEYRRTQCAMHHDHASKHGSSDA